MSGNKAVVVKSTAPLKREPRLDSDLVDELLFGMEVELLRDVDEWLYIRTSYDYEGYLDKKNVHLGSFSFWKNSKKEFIVSAFADVLNSPNYASECLITIPRGASIAVTGEKQDKWAAVELPAGEKGWVREDALIEPQQEKGIGLRQAIVDTALLYLGTQYRFGGKSPMGIDCSGLTSMAYLMNGIIIPRDSEHQINFMKKVQRRDSKPGDLLFFQDHVAIYIGEDKFVHATGQDSIVKINSLNKDSKLYRKDLDEKYITTGTVF